MTIERAREHDIPTVLTLIRRLLAELGSEGEEFAGTNRKKLLADIGRNLLAGRFLALLAWDDRGTPVGVLTLSESFAVYAGGEYGVIDEMYVEPAFRSQGLGRMLVQEAIAVARSRGWFRLDVTGPQDEGHHRALDFYEKLGFEFTGVKLRLLV